MESSMAVMTEVKRPVVWNPREDRVIHAVWLGIFWVGILAGFGLDMKPFLSQSIPWIVYVHAAVYVGWLLLLTVQVLLVIKNKVALHRRLGKFAAGYAVLVVLLGMPTALTVAARTLGTNIFPPQFLAVNLVNVCGFAVMFAWAIAMRRSPAVHKRLILAAMVAFADPGFSRITGNLMTEPKAMWPWFWYMFYGNVLLVVLMLAWDMWRYRRVVWQFAVGGGAVLAGEVWATAMYFDPSWKTSMTHLVVEWGRFMH
jgi:hypothetical protein